MADRNDEQQPPSRDQGTEGTRYVPPQEGPRTTARRVLVVDRLAGFVVRGGGMLVIVAVIGILVFLVATVLPLFRGATTTERPVAGTVPVEGPAAILAVDEYRMLGLAIGARPEVVAFRADDGQVVTRYPITGLEGATIVGGTRSVRTNEAVVATSDGRLAFLTFGFASDFVLGAEREPLLDLLGKPGDLRVIDVTIVQRMAGGNFLRVRPDVAIRGIHALPPGSAPVVGQAYATHEDTGVAVAATADGRVHLVREAITTPLVGPADRTYSSAPIAEQGPKVPPDLFVAHVDEEARTAWFAGRGGGVLRVDVHVDPAVRREVRIVTDADGAPTRIAAAEMVLGGRSIAIADAAGSVSIWSLVSAPPESREGDGKALRRLQTIESTGAGPVRTLASGQTRRTLYLGHESGSVSVAYTTNGRLLASTKALAGPVVALAPGPKDDGFLVAGAKGGFKGFDMDCPHPETGFDALFGKVHYEGYDRPEHLWQSSSATDESELKLSLTPLLFGTLKATFYAMLFALPLALLAALYTSQFMHPRVRALVKPGIEVMASLPSVVLGFLAALLIAPAVAALVPAVFASLLGLLVVGFVAGLAWHGLPLEIRQGISSAGRLAIACALVGAVIALSVWANPWVQRGLFSGTGNPTGDFRIWVQHDPIHGIPDPAGGTGTPLLRVTLGFWGAVLGFFLLPRRLPLSGVSAPLRPVARFAVHVLLPGLLLAFLAGPIEGLFPEGDFRRFLLGTKEPGEGPSFDIRNSLVVGIAMGFAVIPVIYTIAEDALSAIPDSLRSAALGCGASPWQAATRVILPAAVPGLFSAAMIGLGRAVGETMIVVMATGGTAFIDGSIFNGFRTLSANIATELPEASEGGTLFRVLFLAGLLLFALTFVLNTVAEIVRLRFRSKFKGL